MKIIIEIVEHNQQRYNTVGDWFVDEQDSHIMRIRVSHMPTMQAEMCIAIHELVEMMLCSAAKPIVTAKMVDEFDFHWQPHAGIEEPGEDPTAPYHNQHTIATSFEKHLAAALGIDWEIYEHNVQQVSDQYSKR